MSIPFYICFGILSLITMLLRKPPIIVGKLILFIMSPSVIMFLLMYMGNIGVTMSLFVKYALGVSDEKCSRYGLMLVNSACCVLTYSKFVLVKLKALKNAFRRFL